MTKRTQNQVCQLVGPTARAQKLLLPIEAWGLAPHVNAPRGSPPRGIDGGTVGIGLEVTGIGQCAGSYAPVIDSRSVKGLVFGLSAADQKPVWGGYSVAQNVSHWRVGTPSQTATLPNVTQQTLKTGASRPNRTASESLWPACAGAPAARHTEFVEFRRPSVQRASVCCACHQIAVDC